MRKDSAKTSVKGFTLIELMIVVAIIGILAAIVIPQFSEIIVRSQNAERAKKGLPPLPLPNNAPICEGSPVSVTVSGDYLYKMYSSGCVEKVLK